MSHLLQLANGNHVAPYVIKGIRRVPKKGLALIDGFNKLLDFTEEPDDLVIAAYATAIHEVIETGRRFVQPDWNEIRQSVILEKQTRPSTVAVVDLKKTTAAL